MPQGSWIREIHPARPETKDTPGTGPTYESTAVAQGERVDALDEVSTLYESFARSVKIHGDQPALGYRTTTNGKASPYQWLSYAESGHQAAAIADAFGTVGVQAHTCCGIFGLNSPEWMLAMQVIGIWPRGVRVSQTIVELSLRAEASAGPEDCPLICSRISSKVKKRIHCRCC